MKQDKKVFFKVIEVPDNSPESLQGIAFAKKQVHRLLATGLKTFTKTWPISNVTTVSAFVNTIGERVIAKIRVEGSPAPQYWFGDFVENPYKQRELSAVVINPYASAFELTYNYSRFDNGGFFAGLVPSAVAVDTITLYISFNGVVLESYTGTETLTRNPGYPYLEGYIDYEWDNYPSIVFPNGTTTEDLTAQLHRNGTSFVGGGGSGAIDTLIPGVGDAARAARIASNISLDAKRYVSYGLSDGTEIHRLYFKQDLSGNKQGFPYDVRRDGENYVPVDFDPPFISTIWDGGNSIDLYNAIVFDQSIYKPAVSETVKFSKAVPIEIPEDVAPPVKINSDQEDTYRWVGDIDSGESLFPVLLSTETTFVIESGGDPYKAVFKQTHTVRYGFNTHVFSGTVTTNKKGLISKASFVFDEEEGEEIEIPAVTNTKAYDTKTRATTSTLRS